MSSTYETGLPNDMAKPFAGFTFPAMIADFFLRPYCPSPWEMVMNSPVP